MTVWRPPAAIRVKVIGLLFQEGHLFAFDVLNDAGELDGVRPLGGTIEFCETREDALRREFREELGCGIDIVGPWTVFETIYEHQGSAGHEFLFGAPIRLADRSIPIGETVVFAEHDGVLCRARWRPLCGLRQGIPTLYPDGLTAALDALAPGG